MPLKFTIVKEPGISKFTLLKIESDAKDAVQELNSASDTLEKLSIYAGISGHSSPNSPTIAFFIEMKTSNFDFLAILHCIATLNKTTTSVVAALKPLLENSQQHLTEEDKKYLQHVITCFSPDNIEQKQRSSAYSALNNHAVTISVDIESSQSFRTNFAHYCRYTQAIALLTFLQSNLKSLANLNKNAQKKPSVGTTGGIDAKDQKSTPTSETKASTSVTTAQQIAASSPLYTSGSSSSSTTTTAASTSTSASTISSNSGSTPSQSI